MLKLVMFLCVVQLAASSPADEGFSVEVEASISKEMLEIAREDYDRALAEQDRIKQMIECGRVNTALVWQQKEAAIRVQQYADQISQTEGHYSYLLAKIAQAE